MRELADAWIVSEHHHMPVAIVEAAIVSMDWLELHTEGHRRAVFDAQGERWVQP